MLRRYSVFRARNDCYTVWVIVKSHEQVVIKLASAVITYAQQVCTGDNPAFPALKFPTDLPLIDVDVVD